MNDRLRQVVVLLLTVAQAAVGYLSNGWFDPNVGEISDSLSNYFTPAGITFAVWGYLYLALIAYGSTQRSVLSAARLNSSERKSTATDFSPIPRNPPTELIGPTMEASADAVTRIWVLEPVALVNQGYHPAGAAKFGAVLSSG